MARHTGPVCRLCRKEGQKLFLKGTRCHSPKCTMEKKDYPPGHHGSQRRGRRRPTDYALQLREKQKLRAIYGVLERQFARYVKRALSAKGVTGMELLQVLERRLDSVLRKSGFAHSQAQARQIVRHRHFTVNGRIVDIPSFLVSAGDVIQLREKSRELQPVVAGLASGPRDAVGWLEIDPEARRITVKRLPEAGDIAVDVDEQQVVEFYAR